MFKHTPHPDEFTHFMALVDRFVGAIDTVPRTAAGDMMIPPAMVQFKASARAIACLVDGDIPAETATAMTAILGKLDEEVAEFEKTAFSLTLALCGDTEPVSDFYGQFLRTDLPLQAVLDIAHAEEPASTLDEVFFASGVSPQLTTVTLDGLAARFLGGLRRNKTLISATLKLGADLAKALGGVKGRLGSRAAEFLAEQAETLDDQRLYNLERTKGGVTENCFAEVFLTRFSVDVPDLRDELLLNFNLGNTPVTVGAPMGMDAANLPNSPLKLNKNPIQLGKCGQIKGNALLIDFTPTNINQGQEEGDEVGTANRVGVRSAAAAYTMRCPSDETKTLTTTVKADDGQTGATVSIDVRVFKQCGKTDNISQ